MALLSLPRRERSEREGERERERETETERQRERERQTDRQASRQAGRRAGRQAGRGLHPEICIGNSFYFFETVQVELSSWHVKPRQTGPRVLIICYFSGRRGGSGPFCGCGHLANKTVCLLVGWLLNVPATG